jgi:hypothetical protein
MKLEYFVYAATVLVLILVLLPVRPPEKILSEVDTPPPIKEPGFEVCVWMNASDLHYEGHYEGFGTDNWSDVRFQDRELTRQEINGVYNWALTSEEIERLYRLGLEEQGK